MTQIATRALSVLALSAALVASAYAAENSANEARAWLERMSQALATRNYDVRFLHLVGGHAENMRIIHRVAEDGVTERLVSLDGSGREVIRNQNEVVCYLPDRRTVLVEKRIGQNSLLSTVPAYSEGLQAYYDLATPGATRILGRPVQYITVQPRDNFRYGYKLWLDQETALPLKSQLCDRSGRVIEQIVFSEFNTPASIDASLLKSSIQTDGYRWIRQERNPSLESRSVSGVTAADRANSGKAWVVVNPPQGFRLTVTRMQNFGGAGPVRHLVLSDGLASVSVFIEPRANSRGAGSKSSDAKGKGTEQASIQQAVGAELSRVGSALAYSTEVQEHRVTAVGEVPANTLRAIASSVQPESGQVPAESKASANEPSEVRTH